MKDEENFRYVEDKDVLGQSKPDDNMDLNPRDRRPPYLLIIGGMLIIFGLAYHIGFRDKRDVTYYPDMTVHSRGNFDAQGRGIGLHTDYWPSGIKHRDTQYNDEGVLDGTSSIWNRDGVLTYETNYQNGQLHGDVKKWNTLGELILHETYAADKLVTKIK